MHPNSFLRTLWRTEMRDQVFVAMSFDERYRSRFENVIAPSIADIEFEGRRLQPHRVDLSKSGDSILTDIIDGVAHAQLVVADVSCVGRDSATSMPFRNGNVMYEVGLALACRQPSEVLLIRDDKERFLFDVSTVPHMTIDFTSEARARSELRQAMEARLNERKLVADARISMAIASLTREEIEQLRVAAKYDVATVWGRRNSGSVDFTAMAAMPRLLDKGLAKVVGEFGGGNPAYALTPLGREAAKLVATALPQFKADEKVEGGSPSAEQPG